MLEKNIKKGITLFSLSIDFHSKKYSLEQCLSVARELGFEGIEIVASQMIPGYPCPSQEWVESFILLLKKYNLEPVCYSAYIDMGLRQDRDLTEEEIIKFTLNDMKNASLMGFSYVRTQHAISPKILEMMIPYAKDYGIWLGVEMHRPHNLRTPVWQEYMELFERRGSEHIGIVPDMGVFQARPHLPFLNNLVVSGMRKDIVQQLDEYHGKGTPLTEAIKLIGNLSEKEMELAKELYSTFEPAPVEDFKRIIPHSRYMHGKFYYIDENYKDNCVPYDRILPFLQENGYKGYMVSEYEGHLHTDKVDAVEQLQRHVEMEKRILGY